jgi:hypothetical protein
MKQRALHLLLLILCVWCSRDLQRHWDEKLDPLSASEAGLLLGLRVTLTVLSWAGMLVLVWRGLPAEPKGRDFRTLSYCTLFALACASLAHFWVNQESALWLSRSIFFAALMGGQAVWTALRIYAQEREPSRWGQRLDVVCMNLLLSVLIMEVLVVVWASWNPSPLVFSDSVDQSLEAMRQPPGAVHFGSRLNSGGYLDDEFFEAGPRDLVVAVLADSFGLGVVPREYNFVSVAESQLRARLGAGEGLGYERIALHNFGVPSIGLAEYAFILEDEALATRPKLVVVCLFVGNDIHEGNAFGVVKGQRYVLQKWLFWNSTNRLLTLMRSSAAERHFVAGVGRSNNSLGGVPAYIHNSDLETPTFSEERFFEIESTRARIIRPRTRRMVKRYEAVFRGLKYFRDALGEKLVVVLLPDEFQVNDALFERLISQNSLLEKGMRDWPQKRIFEFCRELEIVCVDMLPSLRDAEREGRTYHLRDTHFNAWGNHVAGVELEKAIFQHLP